MKSIELISKEDLEKILSIGKAKHYEETAGLEYLTEKYITDGCIDEEWLEDINYFHNILLR